MPLIKCDVCSAEISDNAIACPACGDPCLVLENAMVSNDEGIARNTAELGKLILALSSGGVGILKFKAATLTLLEQAAITAFCISIISLFVAYWIGSSSVFKFIDESENRDRWVAWSNNLCNFAFFVALLCLTISVWR